MYVSKNYLQGTVFYIVLEIKYLTLDISLFSKLTRTLYLKDCTHVMINLTYLASKLIFNIFSQENPTRPG
jgi:hypothetical protein